MNPITQMISSIVYVAKLGGFALLGSFVVLSCTVMLCGGGV